MVLRMRTQTPSNVSDGGAVSSRVYGEPQVYGRGQDPIRSMHHDPRRPSRSKLSGPKCIGQESTDVPC
jgi:hypothetical protein